MTDKRVCTAGAGYFCTFECEICDAFKEPEKANKTMTERFIIGYKESNGLMCVGLYDTEREIWGALTPLDNENNAPEWAMKQLESLRDRLNAKCRKEQGNE